MDNLKSMILMFKGLISEIEDPEKVTLVHDTEQKIREILGDKDSEEYYFKVLGLVVPTTEALLEGLEDA